MAARSPRLALAVYVTAGLTACKDGGPVAERDPTVVVAASSPHATAARAATTSTPSRREPRRAETTRPALPSPVTIPAGAFRMGSTTSDLHSALPLHQVTLSAYTIDAHTVTNDEYRACEVAGACTPPGLASSSTRQSYYADPAYGAYPVVHVSWTQASAFCAWAGKRLPTEAEWEKAARGSSDTRTYPWGEEEPTCALANFFGASYCVGDTDTVGSRPAGASPNGVHDMAGNVLEWVADWHDREYYSACASGCTNPKGPATGVHRSIRGSSWFMDAPHLRLAIRSSEFPVSQLDFLGFRCAK